jgi:hypothetical protein
MKTLEQLKVRIFADGADKKDMLEVYRLQHVKGFTKKICHYSELALL